jgi:hypothetical protein
MFDYIMFLNYGSMISIVLFSLLSIASIINWYDYEVGKNKDIKQMQLLIKGQQIKSYGVAKSLGYLILSVLIFMSIK